jgi:hypothetical protein
MWAKIQDLFWYIDTISIWNWSCYVAINSIFCQRLATFAADNFDTLYLLMFILLVNIKKNLYFLSFISSFFVILGLFLRVLGG